MEFGLKSRIELSSMEKDSVINYAIDLGKTFNELHKYLLDPTEGIIPKLQSQLAVSQRINEYLLKQLGLVEKQSNSNSQYARKETIELHGVPESLGMGETLENNVLAILNDLIKQKPPAKKKPSDNASNPDSPTDTPATDAEDTTTNSPDLTIKDMHAIHRLYKKDRVIIKCTNRRTAHQLLRNKLHLRGAALKDRHGITGNLYLNESMCPAVKKLFYTCKILKNADVIHHYSFFNGSLRAKKTALGREYTIFHISDLCTLTGLDEDRIKIIVDN